MEVFISIVVPIYNGENFISKMMESLIEQTVTNFEVILVDDGSSDASGVLCDEYSRQYSWIKTVHKKNGGLSTARNVGIKQSIGTHIMFLDVDDYLENQTVELVVEVVKKYNPDLIDFGMIYVNNLGERNPGHHKIKKDKVFGDSLIRDRLIPQLISVKNDPDAFIFDYTCNKVFNSEIVKKNKIIFKENRRTWEDRIFVVEYLKHCHSYYSMNQCLYNYVSVRNSLSRRYDMQFFDIILDNYHTYYEMFKDEYNFDTQFCYYYWSKSIENMISRSLEEKNNQHMIKKNIINVLQNDLVKSWFGKRENVDDRDRIIQQFVLNGDIDKLCNFLVKELKVKKRKEKINQLKYFIYKRVNKNGRK